MAKAKAKVTKVKLVVPSLGVDQELSFEHAENLLRMPNNGGWQLPEDSEFVLTENGLERRRDKKRAEGEQEG